MKQLLKNLFHTAVAKVLTSVVQFGVSLLLARRLSAGDYGVVSFANVLLALLIRMNGMGIAPAVIQAKVAPPKLLNTAATLNLLLSLSAFFLAQLCAPLCGILLKSPASESVVRVLAFSFLLGPIGFLSGCMLNRDMNFRVLRTPQVVGAVLRGGSSVAMAVAGFKYWSLVVGNIVGTLINNVMLRIYRPVQFAWKLDYSEARKLLSVGVPLASADILVFLVLYADNFYIGYALGPQTLGFYTIAFSWATLTCTTIYEVVHTVLFPKFSQMQEDVIRVSTAFLRSLRLVLFLTALLNGALFVASTAFLFTVLGHGTDRWMPAQTTLEILCLYGAIRAAIETIANPILAQGNSKLLLRAAAVVGFIELPVMLWVSRHCGLVGVGILVTVAYSSQVFFYVPYLKRSLGINVAALMRIIVPVAIAAGCAVIIVTYLPHLPLVGFTGLILRSCIFSLIFVAIHEACSGAAIFKEARTILKHFWARTHA